MGKKWKGGNVSVFGERTLQKTVEDANKLGLDTLTIPVRVVALNANDSNPQIDQSSFQEAKNIINGIAGSYNIILEPYPYIANGTIVETAWNPSNFNQWFVAWENVLVELATYAQSKGLAGMYIASNLVYMEGWIYQWTQIINNLRNIYSGNIFYRTNWWVTAHWSQQHIDDYNAKLNREIFGLVDVIAIACYFELTAEESPSKQKIIENIHSTTLHDRRQNVVQEVKKFHDRWGKPIFFGELGIYPYSKAPSMPYAYSVPTLGTYNEQVQVNFFQAYYEVFKDYSWWLGFSIYAIADSQSLFNPAGKQAESVIKAMSFDVKSLVGTGQLSILDLNDAIISGTPPANPSNGTLWVDENASPKLLKKWNGTDWIIIGEVSDEGTGDTVSEIEHTLGNMTNDNIIEFNERKVIKDKITDIIGYVIADTATTLPTATTLDSSLKGGLHTVRRSALMAGISTTDAKYVAVATTYGSLKNYLDAMTPVKPWDIREVNKGSIINVTKSSFRTNWLNYYNAVNDLAILTAEQLKKNVEDVKFGGTNYASNGNFERLLDKSLWKDHYLGQLKEIVDISTEAPPFRYAYRVRNTTAQYGGISQPTLWEGLSAEALVDQEITISFWLKYQNIVQGASNWQAGRFGELVVEGLTSGGAKVYRYPKVIGGESTYVTGTNMTWVKHSATLKLSLPSTALKLSKISFRHLLETCVGEFWTTGLQIEIGNKVSDWSESPYDVSQRLTEVEFEITDEKITQKVTSSSSYIQTINTINTNINKAQGDIDNLELGGRNLAIGTSSVNWGAYGSSAISFSEGLRSKAIKVTRTGGTSAWGVQQINPSQIMRLQSGEKYILSFKIRGTVGLGMNYTYIMKVGNANQSTTTPANAIGSETEYQKISVPFVMGIPSEFSYIMISTSELISNAWFEITEIQVERGDKATDWSQAPEDIETLINQAQTTADQAKLSVDDMMSDLKVTPIEKAELARLWYRIQQEYTQLLALGNSLTAVSTTNLTTAYNALNGTAPRIQLDILATMGTTYTFGTVTLRDNFKTQMNLYFQRAEEISRAITDAVNATATSAKNGVDDMMSDLKITPLEKTTLQIRWNEIQAQYTELASLASSLSVATTTFNSAYNALNTTAPRIQTDILANMTTTYTLTTATRDAFKAQIKTYYDQAEAINKAITTAVNTTANDAQLKANDMMSDLKVTPLEKNELDRLWKRIQSEYTQLNAQALSVGVASAIRTNYTTAYNALNGVVPRIQTDILANMTTTYTFTVANRDTFKTQLNTYFTRVEEISTAITDVVNNKIDNLQISGVNLVQNSTFNDGLWSSSSSILLDPEEDKPNSKITQVTANNTGTTIAGAMYNPIRKKASVKAGDQITISLDFYCASEDLKPNPTGGIFTFRHSTASTGGTVTSFTTPTITTLGGYTDYGKWRRLSQTYTFTSDINDQWLMFGLYASNSVVGTTVQFKIREVQVEFGNRATAWKLAQEDIAGQIDYVITQVNNALIEITDESIVRKVTESTTFQNALDDKANASDISGLASLEDVEGVSGTIDEKISDYNEALQPERFALGTEVEETARGILQKFSATGGMNLIRNSIGYANFDFWYGFQTNIAHMRSIKTTELDATGYGSGFFFPPTTVNRSMSQDANVVQGRAYTLSFDINKDNNTAGDTGAIWVQVLEGTTVVAEQKILGNTVTTGYENYVIPYVATSNKAIVRIIANTVANATITGIMFSLGDVALQWSLARGEAYNTNVRMDLNGVRVSQIDTSSGTAIEIGYTQISPQEFAGYYDADGSGIFEKVFYLNGDETVTKKLVATEEITMGTIKIVKLDSANNKGWAFVPIVQ